MGGLQSTERSLSVTASKGLSALRAAPDLCCAVNQRLTSVVREIRTLRSVGAGGSAPGDPVGRRQPFPTPIRWPVSDGRLCYAAVEPGPPLTDDRFRSMKMRTFRSV